MTILPLYEAALAIDERSRYEDVDDLGLVRRVLEELARRKYIRPLAGRAGGPFTSEDVEIELAEDVDLVALVRRYGPERVAGLVAFAFDWKYADWDVMRSTGRGIPDLGMCRQAFADVPMGLMRGVRVELRTPMGRRQVGETFELRLRGRSISSWTERREVASSFSSPSSSPVDALMVGLVLEMVAPGDAVHMAVPANSPKSPAWYTTLYYMITSSKGKAKGGGHIEGEAEHIVSLSHATVRVIGRDDDEAQDRLYRRELTGRARGEGDDIERLRADVEREDRLYGAEKERLRRLGMTPPREWSSARAELARYMRDQKMTKRAMSKGKVV